MSNVKRHIPDFLRLVEETSEVETSSPQQVVEQGINAMFREYASYVGSIALRILGSPDDVDDIVQEVFLTAHLKLDQLRDPGAVRVWLGKIAVSKSSRYLKKRRWMQRLPLTSVREVEWAGASPELKLQVQRLYQALEQLPVEERVVWTLRHVQRATIAETAEFAGISPTTVKRRLRRATATLEEVFGDE